MIHHLGVFASDFDRSRAFYVAALEPLAIVLGYESKGVAEFWSAESDTPSLSLERAVDTVTRGLHIAFAAPNRQAVIRFFDAAIAVGAVERHSPRHWQEYSAFCAFVSDPDG